MTQRRLTKAVKAGIVKQWDGDGIAADRVRRTAHSAKGASKLYEVVPSVTLDTHLSASEFAMNVACRLGVDVMDAGGPCKMCGMQLDSHGIHAQSCMGGGDAVREHNAVRDVFFDYCERGGLRPVLEAPGLWAEGGQSVDAHRPADVLVMPHLALARVLPDGSRAVRSERVCFDFAVVNALGSSHWSDKERGGGCAAEAYDIAQKRRNRAEVRCNAAGLKYWPVVFEQQGGTSKGTDAAIRAVSEAIATREGREASGIRRELLCRIAVVLARSAASMIGRRQRHQTAHRPRWTTIAEELCRGAGVSDEGDEASSVRASAGTSTTTVGAPAARDIRL